MKHKLKADTHSSNTDGDGEAEENDSDDDFLDDDDYMSPAQQKILEQVAENTLRLRDLATRGLGAHLNESPEHFLQLLQNPRVTNMVLHIVDESDCGSALVDVALEALAQQFSGTYFRRMARFDAQNHPSEFFRGISSSKLVSIKDNEVVDQSPDVMVHFFAQHHIGKTGQIKLI